MKEGTQLQRIRRAAIPHVHLAGLCLILLLLLLHMVLGTDPLSPSPYNSYTRQALAWRSGQTHLPEDVPHLELAIKDGRYYVSFPPVPSVPIYFLSFLFGGAVPDGLLVKLYALIAYYAFCCLFLKLGWPKAGAAWLSFLLCTASSMLPMLLSGAVWYQAQVMAFMWIALAILLVWRKRPTLGLFCYALSVGCRPFHALYGPLLFYLHLFTLRHEGEGFGGALRRMLPGVLVGLCVAAAYAWYNQLRFGAPLEFGHNYLPEFSFQGGTQFSLKHVPGNARSYLFSLPFEYRDGAWQLKQFGFSVFIANPILLLMLVRAVKDIVKRELKAGQALTLLLFAIHLLLLLMHRTFGGFQFGARYAVDLIPYAALYLAQDQKRQHWRLPSVLLMLLSLAFSVYGALHIRLPG